MKLFTRSLAAFALLLTASLAVVAQTTSAGITGVVTDPNGAVVPNATVVVTNTATNQQRTVTSNGEGIYAISPLPVGIYEVKVSSAGLRK